MTGRTAPKQATDLPPPLRRLIRDREALAEPCPEDMRRSARAGARDALLLALILLATAGPLWGILRAAPAGAAGPLPCTVALAATAVPPRALCPRTTSAP